MKITKLTLLIVLLLTLVSLTFAVKFTATIAPEEQSAKTNETAEYTLNIVHDGAEDISFELYSPDVFWDIRTEKSLLVPKGERGLTTKLLVSPLNVNPGFYGVPLVIKELNTKNSISKIVTLELHDPYLDAEGYRPALRAIAKLNKELMPNQPVQLTVFLENQNSRNIDEVEIKVRSKLFIQDYTTSIEGLAKKEINFNFTLDPITPPQKDSLKVSMFVRSKSKSYQFDSTPSDYEVIPIKEIEKTTKEDKQWLKTTKTLTFVNKGNVPDTTTYKEQVNYFDHLFIKRDPAAEYVDGSYDWEIYVPVGEKREIVITLNYWPLFILGIIVLTTCIIYLVFRSPIVLNKKAKIVSTKEGGISEMKIVLSVYNRSPKTMRNVRIIDVVPKLAEYMRSVDAGTLAPTKEPTIGHPGTILHWHIDQLEPLSEVLITYRIKNQLSVLEGLTLPVAVAKFEIASHMERSTKSNVLQVGF